MQLVSFARYLTAPGVQWTQAYYNANKLIKAVKRKEVKGFANLQMAGISLRLDDTTSYDDVMSYMGQVITTSLLEPLSQPHYLVPIPHSACTVGCGESSAMCSLARAIAKFCPCARIWDGLRWKEEMLKSSQGGTRDYQTLKENCATIADIPKGAPIILIDDVATTCNHFRAAGDFLKELGATCDLSIAVGRTVHDTSLRALGGMIEQI